jgi:hypothetical protein
MTHTNTSPYHISRYEVTKDSLSHEECTYVDDVLQESRFPEKIAQELIAVIKNCITSNLLVFQKRKNSTVETMMLSPSAARLGTSIRLKGKSIPFRHYSIGKNRRWQHQVFGTTSTPVVPPTSRLPKHVRPVVVVSDITYPIRYKSTTATVSVIDDDDQPDEGICTTNTTDTTTTNTALGWSHRGHAAAAEYRLQQQQQENQHVVNTIPTTTTLTTTTTTTTTTPTVASASESWRINLGRGTDNAWLMGSRKDDEWFTGIAPSENCPGRVLYIVIYFCVCVCSVGCCVMG